MFRATPCSSHHLSAHEGYAVDLHIERTEPASLTEENPRRLVGAEILGVDRVDRREVGRVRAIDVAFHDPLEARTCRLEAGFQMLQDTARLLVDRQDVVAARLRI